MEITLSRRDLYAIEVTLPREVDLAIRRLRYRKVISIAAKDVADETLAKLGRHVCDASTREYLHDGAPFLARGVLRRKWGSWA